MAGIGVLRCPVCDKRSLYRLEEVENRETAKELSTRHLESHRLNESKRGLYRVQMADDLETTEIADITEVSLGTWVETGETAATTKQV
jgi:hypothetical protein